MEEEKPLSFSELTRRLNAMPEFQGSTPNSARRTMYGFGTTLAAYCASFLVTRLLSPGLAQIIGLSIVVAIEVAGLCITMWYSRGEFYSLREPLNDFARQLDHDLPHHFELLDWLARQPIHILERHAAMARFRRERFTQKIPLIAGNIPTLGLVPVAIAIYLQMREYAAGRQPSWIDLFAGIIIAMLYMTAWLAALTKARIETLDMYLQRALERKTSGLTASRIPGSHALDFAI